MILYTSVTKQAPNLRRATILYAGISAFCLIIFIIYDRFSHNVRSPFMTFLFLWPLILGVLPVLLLWKFRKLPRPGRFTWNAYNSGVAALTVSSLLRGIFEIAGTASPFQTGLMFAGIVITGVGVIGYLADILAG